MHLHMHVHVQLHDTAVQIICIQIAFHLISVHKQTSVFRLHVRLHLHLHTCFKLHEFVARTYRLCKAKKQPTPSGLKQGPFQSKELPAGCTLRDPDMGGAVDFIRTHFIQQLRPQKSWGRGFSAVVGGFLVLNCHGVSVTTSAIDQHQGSGNS